MGQTRYVLKSRTEKTGRDETREERNPARLRRDATFKKVGVETEDAAAPRHVRIVHVEREKKRVGKHVNVDGIGGEVIRVDVVHNRIVVEEVEQQVQHQHERRAIR